MGCVGYKNYQYFLQFSFYASLWASTTCLFVSYNFSFLSLTYWDLLFYVTDSLLQFFGWFMFFTYGTLAIKGLTVIEAADRWTAKREEVVDAH